jgi:epoxyqueuosine reductase
MTTSTSEPIEARIRDAARKIGFDACGLTGVEAAWPAAAHLQEFVALERHGDMAWMATTAERRAHPRAMWPEARSAIVLGVNYGPDADPLAALALRSRGTISVYAQGDDYHALIKARLKALARWLASETPCQVKVSTPRR